MLEHGIPASEAVPSAASPQDAFYTPPESPAPLTGQAAAPDVKRFNRKMLAAVSVMAVLIVALAFIVGLRELKEPAKIPETASAKPPTTNPLVNALPDYGSVELGAPRPGDLGPPSTAGGNATTGQPHQLTPFEQYAEQVELERLRNVDRARSAGVSFTNAGGNEGAAGAAPASGESGIQERLLDLAQRAGGGSGNAAPAGAGDREDQNHQDAKQAFTDKERGTQFQLHAGLQRPQSPYTLFAGTILPCVMTQGIDSDLPGQIGCMISQNVYDTVSGKHLLLPQGTKAIGTYDSHVGYGQERVLVVWTRLLRPDGSALALEGMPGVDLSGLAGLTGPVNNHYLRLLAGVVLGSILGASAQIAVGANSQNPSFAELAVQGAGQNINQAGQQITRRNLNIQPTIEVRPGTRLNIFSTKDLILPPYT